MHPELREDSQGAKLLDRAEQMVESARSAPGEPLRTVAYERDEWLTSLLQAHGYVKGAYLNPYLTQPLDRAAPDPVVAAGFAVRESGWEAELEQWAGAMNESFGGPPEPGARAINSTRTFIEYCERGQDISLVAVSEQGVIASYALCLIDPVTKLGEFDPVGTRPSSRRMGLARAVMLTGLRYLKEKGMETAVVRTDADNHPAISLYESVGFTVTDRLHEYVKGA